METKKEKIMRALVDAGLNSDELNWASSHIPSTDETGKIVPEGLTFKGIVYKHEASSTAEAMGLDRKMFRELAGKLEDTVEKLHNGVCDGTHCPSQSQITEAILPQLTEVEAAFLILRGIDTLNEASHRGMPSGGGTPSLMDLLSLVSRGKAKIEDIRIEKVSNPRRKKKKAAAKSPRKKK